MHTRPTLPELTFISFSLILYMLSLQGVISIVVISYLYIFILFTKARHYLIYQIHAGILSVTFPVASTDSVTQFPSLGFRPRKHETFYKLGTLFLHCHNYVTALGETVSHQYQNVLAAGHSAANQPA